MLRRLLALIGLAGGAVAAVLALRRRLDGRRERIEVHFEDGSFVSFGPTSPETQRLLPYARDIAATVQHP
ncbi:MAG TPA: hypothetical protein VE088_03570 [Gaiellaceae bacterium]|jgi:hypothetical protein|nr:hypothetical protein [Gaiellaceae bacterium]